jgi:hypothetical protein
VEFKRSAGIFVAGISLFFGGPLLSFIGTTFATLFASKDENGLASMFFGLALFGVVVSLAGLILIIVAAHRALVKIDALPTRVQTVQRQNWPAV